MSDEPLIFDIGDVVLILNALYGTETGLIVGIEYNDDPELDRFIVRSHSTYDTVVLRHYEIQKITL
jgi:hypothetical protein